VIARDGAPEIDSGRASSRNNLPPTSGAEAGGRKYHIHQFINALQNFFHPLNEAGLRFTVFLTVNSRCQVN
jgi:hypothetical protein